MAGFAIVCPETNTSIAPASAIADAVAAVLAKTPCTFFRIVDLLIVPSIHPARPE
jgi:hypothetical protein